MKNLKIAPAVLTYYSKGNREERADLLAVESPLEIRLSFGSKDSREHRTLSITMRTPGDDLELAVGYLFGEGIISTKSDIKSIRFCKDVREAHRREEGETTILVELMPEVRVDTAHFSRNVYTNSSCGVCGKTNFSTLFADSLIYDAPPVSSLVPIDILQTLPQKLREQQAVFARTGGLHAAALFDLKGELLTLREDIGRHNALDKLIGAALYKDNLPLHQSVILLSGRIGYELVEKAVVARVAILAAIGAPSSLAVETAQENDLTLIGFLRPSSFNCYSNPERLAKNIHSQNEPDKKA
ncbi:MAG: formate dehydrogenase accessory sulfurtransferase FdhD [Calditrichia bacterium]